MVSFEDVDRAWGWLEDHYLDLDCLILDAMLPHGERYTSASTDAGLLTGVLFYREVRDLCGLELPIFFLTNSLNPAIQELIENDANVDVFLKADIFYDEFAKKIRRRLKESGC